MVRSSPASRSTSDASSPRPAAWRERLYEIVFEADTPAGKWFDVVLILAILLSIGVVMLESVDLVGVGFSRHRADQMDGLLYLAEWVFTILFTVEYVLRLVLVKKPWRYATSFFGAVDLLAILPTFISLLIPGSQELLVIRTLRLLRVFRVFKLARYLTEAHSLMLAVRQSLAKVAVFLVAVLSIVVIMGAVMHLVEGPESGFTSMPQSIYWAIVTMTTVGYGDITPQTPLGQTLAALMMVLAYSLIIVPTSVVTAEIMQQHGANTRIDPVSTQCCPDCSKEGHDYDAKHCKHCGETLNE